MFQSQLLCNRRPAPSVGGRRSSRDSGHSPARITGKPDHSMQNRPQLRRDIKVCRHKQQMIIRRCFGDYPRMFRKRVGSIEDGFIGRVVVVMRGNPFRIRLILMVMTTRFHTFSIETERIAMMMMRKHSTTYQQYQCQRDKQSGNFLFQHFAISKRMAKVQHLF